MREGISSWEPDSEIAYDVRSVVCYEFAMDEISLTTEERDALYSRCERAIHCAERFNEDLWPADGMKYQVLGQKGIVPFAIGWGVVGGLIGYVIWSLIVGWLDLDRLLASIGLPMWIASNIPVFFAAFGGASGAATVLVSEAREARHRLLTERQNAHARATALHWVLEDLRDMMPDAIPDLDDYAHTYDDDEPNALVEKAIGRRGPPAKRRTYRRAEPPLSSS